MARKKAEIDNSKINKAREVVSRFGHLSLGNMSLSTLRDLVRVQYSTIYGRPVESVRQDQLYRIAERVYNESHDIVKIEDNIVHSLENLINASSPEKIESSAKEATAQLKENNISLDCYLFTNYLKAKESKEAEYKQEKCCCG